MPGPSVQRTIVKSKPELWSELSDVESLAKHLDVFGEIAITELNPETAVAWEGDRVRGTVTLERSGWGTKVTVTARSLVDEARCASSDGPAEQDREVGAAPEEPEAAPEPEVQAVAPEPEAVEPIRRAGFWARMRARWRERAAVRASSEAFVGAGTTNASQLDLAQAALEAGTEVDAAAAVEVAAEPEPVVVPELDPEHEIVLTAMLDRLGQAHHRPFSRG